LKIKYLSGDQVENEMGGACSMYGGERKGAYRILVGRPEGRNNLGQPVADWRIILKWMFKKWNWRRGLD
jgi:hypothetical protein